MTSLVAGLTTTVQCLVAPQEYLATLSDITSLLTRLEEVLKEGLSTETVNTITGEEETSSQNSTPTPNLQSERFSYDVDPELGAFV